MVERLTGWLNNPLRGPPMLRLAPHQVSRFGA